MEIKVFLNILGGEELVRQEVIRGNCQVLLYTPTHQIPSQPARGVSLFLLDSFTFFEVWSW